ncbi:hypothetical protein FAI41_04710 [Acetobacteraceae bacterium]|nr:hypothetical protein FAI41_04710 [Acetobacteraceae bacterium]
MRFYNIEIFKPGKDISSNDFIYHFSTHQGPNNVPTANPFSGVVNPAYLRLDFEYTLTNNAIIPRMHIMLYGQDPNTFSQTNNLNNGYVKLSGGVVGVSVNQNFSIGEIFSGKITQSTAQTILEQRDGKTQAVSCLELFCEPKSMDFSPAPRFFKCEANDLLSNSIKTSLKGYDVDVSGLKDLKCRQYEYFRANTMPEFVAQLTRSVQNWGKDWQKQNISAHYNGNGLISFTSEKISADTQNVKKLTFQEIIGQPYYNGPPKDDKDAQNWEVSVITPLRSDIAIGDILLLPSASDEGNRYGILSPCGNPEGNQSLFTGKWQVVMIHYYGQSREPEAEKWTTTFGLKRFS